PDAALPWPRRHRKGSVGPEEPVRWTDGVRSPAHGPHGWGGSPVPSRRVAPSRGWPQRRWWNLRARGRQWRWRHLPPAPRPGSSVPWALLFFTVVLDRLVLDRRVLDRRDLSTISAREASTWVCFAVVPHCACEATARPQSFTYALFTLFSDVSVSFTTHWCKRL